MICPHCLKRTRTVDTVHNDSENETYRKLKCGECGEVFYTIEYAVEYDDKFKKTWSDNHRLKAFYGGKKDNEI